MTNTTTTLDIYTDGACHPPSQTGAWAAILFGVPDQDEEGVLQGIVPNTTHQRMELTAAIEALRYAHNQAPLCAVVLYTDSQYVADLPVRRPKLEQQGFITKKGKQVQNADLLKVFFDWLNKVEVSIYKVKAHQKVSDLPNHNRKVDKLVRKVLRQAIKVQS
jgi:ribonuclease HI